MNYCLKYWIKLIRFIICNFSCFIYMYYVCTRTSILCMHVHLFENVKNFWVISGPIFIKESIGYTLFQKIGSFFKMLVTQKLFAVNRSSFLHSIRTSICIRKCNKNLEKFWGQFLEKLCLCYSLCF